MLQLQTAKKWLRMKYEFRQWRRHRFLLVVADEIPLASLRLGSQCCEISWARYARTADDRLVSGRQKSACRYRAHR